METPITEHPKFDIMQCEELQTNKRWSSTHDYHLHDIEVAMNKGAAIAQQILSEEHDLEMEEFDKWKTDKVYNTYILNGSILYSIGTPELATFKELLDLFRKERENG